MKKIIILTILMAFMLTGCDSLENNKNEIKDDRFIWSRYVTGSNEHCYCYLVVDKETKVQYLFTRAGYGGGTTVLIDSDGKPLLYDK